MATLCVMNFTDRRSTSASSSGGFAGLAHSRGVCCVTALNLIEMCDVVYFVCVAMGVSHCSVHVGRWSPSILWPVTLKKYPSFAGANFPLVCSLGRNTMLPVLCVVVWNMGSMFGETCFRRDEELGRVSLDVSVSYHSALS